MSGDGQPSERDPEPEPSWAARGRSWKRKVDASSKLASHQVRESLGKVADRADESDSSLAKWSKGSAAGLSERIDGFGDSAAGKNVARATRSVGKVMAKVPGLTALSDTVGIHHGVDLLTAAVKENPKDSERLLQLALALRRKNHDMSEIRAMKAVMKPMSLVTSSGMRMAASFDADDNALPMDEKLLRAAFKRTMAIHKARPTNADNLHLLARIYLAQGHIETARKLGRISLAASPTYPGDVYTTLTAVEVAAGDGLRAEQYSLLADRNGSTVAHRYVADLVLTTQGTIADRVREHERRVSLVKPEDDERYFGVSLDPSQREVYRRLSDQHMTKVRALRDLPIPGLSAAASGADNTGAPLDLQSLPPPTSAPLPLPAPGGNGPAPVRTDPAPPQRPNRTQ